MKTLALLIVLSPDPGALSGSWLLTTMELCKELRAELVKEYKTVLCVETKDLKSELLRF